MRPRISAILISALLLWANVSAIDYTIKEVIEIGEADFVPFLGPLKWSPDGTKLAFFKNGILKISDTLGNVSEVTKLEMAPHRFDWVSENQIAASMRSFPGSSINTEEKLILIETGIGQKTSVHEFTTAPGYRKETNKTTSSGPYETVEGNKYYLFTTYNSGAGKTIVERRAFLNNRADGLKDDNMLRWGDDGLYLVKLDESDSSWLAKKPFQKMGPKQEISSDLSFAMDGGQLFNLRDSTIIVLDTLLGPPPENTYGCGIIWFSFNPVAPEVVFTITCDDGVNYIINSIATFDYETFELTKIDPQIGISNCASPEYSPDGKSIAFLANGKGFILKRQIQ